MWADHDPMNRKKFFRLVFATLLILIICALGWAYWKASNKTDDFHFRPEVIISGIGIEDPGQDFLRVFPTLRIINDLGIEARVRALEFELRHENDLVLKNLIKKNFTIIRQDTTQMTLPMIIDKHDLEVLNKSFAGYKRDSARFQMKISFKLDVPLRGYRDFDINKEVDLPVFRVLEVESRKISLEKFSLSHPDLSMELKIKNPNSFPIVIDACALDLQISDDLDLKGKAVGVQRLEAGSSETIPLDLHVEDMNLLKVAWKSIVKDDKTPFKSKLTFRIISKNKMINHAELVILKDGKLNEIKK
jgi:LEA14-like dessication related protein